MTEPAARRRVVVTGLGAVTPVGNDMPTTWRNLVAGKSGVTFNTRFDTTDFKRRIQAEVRDFNAEAFLDAKTLRYMDRNVQYGVISALEAVRDAGVTVSEDNQHRVGVVFGSGGGGLELLLTHYDVLREKGPRRITPFLMTNFISDAASGHIAIQIGATGPNYAPTSACATGANAVGDGLAAIKLHKADVMVVGGSEAVLLPLFQACFESMRVLAEEAEPPEASCKPFDLHRTGFIPGEGACTLVLEDLAHAQARGARIYAEVLGAGSSSDAYDMVASEEHGRGLLSAMRQALEEAAIDLRDVGYVNTHGTATQLNDRVETAAIKQIFGAHAHRMLVSSIKAATGHMMAASGALECAVVALALKEGVIPPTLNYETPDPACDLDCVPNQARRVALTAAISTSVGLGGHNAAVLMRRWDG